MPGCVTMREFVELADGYFWTTEAVLNDDVQHRRLVRTQIEELLALYRQYPLPEFAVVERILTGLQHAYSDVEPFNHELLAAMDEDADSGAGFTAGNRWSVSLSAQPHTQRGPISARLDPDRSSVYLYTMKSREVIVRLAADGWWKVAQKGSHIQLKHPTKPGRVSVPYPKREIPIGTLKSFEKQAGIKLR
jgi:predicted RNA binding protein YcfA (HicA-like mRNA interferase family)